MEDTPYTPTHPSPGDSLAAAARGARAVLGGCQGRARGGAKRHGPGGLGADAGTGPVRGGAAAGAAPGGFRRARVPAGPRRHRHSLGDLGVQVADPEAVPVLQRALGEDGGVLQRQRLAARLHGRAEGGGGRGGGAGRGPGRSQSRGAAAAPSPRRPRPALGAAL